MAHGNNLGTAHGVVGAAPYRFRGNAGCHLAWMRWKYFEAVNCDTNEGAAKFRVTAV